MKGADEGKGRRELPEMGTGRGMVRRGLLEILKFNRLPQCLYLVTHQRARETRRDTIT